MELAAVDRGEGQAALLLHGQPGSGTDLSALARELEPRMRVIVPDRPGYGSTGGEPAGFGDNARQVVALLDRLELRSAVLAGQSWGAGVALAVARVAPERVDGLALISPVSPTARLGPLDRLFAQPVLGPPLLRAGFGLVVHSLSLTPIRRLAARALPYDDLLATAAAWSASTVWRSFFVEQRALLDELPSLAGALGSIETQTTVLVGTRDRIAGPDQAEALAMALPKARFVSVPRAGHLLPQLCPQLVAAEIQALGTRH